MKRINIEIIPHNKQRYNTCGDYWIDKKDNTLQVRISKTNNVYEQAVIIHELFELFSVLNEGISIERIDKFDTEFEKIRKQYPKIIGNQEPGDMVSAPYHKHHQLSTDVEKVFITHNQASWDHYEKTINQLK